jgi:superfamily II DNA/RNA helicase
MLKITTDGRKAALDLRLVEDDAPFSYKSKVAKCAENAFGIYMSTREQKGTQLIFCDTSTPKEGFNIYDEVKKLLLYMGVKPEHIAFVHDATTEAQRSKMFAKVRSGDIRILLGSTFKLGMGVNVQDRLVAIHHLDVPWRPADMTQREGRILRQGNQNDKVQIFRYITEGSFDAYSWQLLETKQRFISELLEGSLADRSGSDVESTVLSYAEVKALAIGNPFVKQRVETANELSRVLALHRKEIETHIRLEQELLEMPAKINHQADLANKCLADVRWYRANRQVFDKEERKELREKLAQAIASHLSDMPEEDVVAMSYHGFDIILPANMMREKPHIWLQHEGKYFVELGESGLGALLRVDNFLEKLAEHYQKLRDGFESLKSKQEALKEEVTKKEDYADQIETLKLKLEKLDKKLGVNKK